MTVLLISDLHLEPARPEIMRAFTRLLRGEAREAGAVYILGDLFDAWIGDDDDSALATAVAQELKLVARTGVEICFQHGNRDFLLGEAYARRCGMRLLPEEFLLEAGNETILLLHGDTLCTDDVDYQRFRAQSRDPDWQAAMLRQPLDARRALAARARAESTIHTSTTPLAIMDVNEASVANRMRSQGVTQMIHGHTHRPAVHQYPDQRRRIVLAPWHDRGSALSLDSGEIAEIQLAFDTNDPP